MSLFSITSAQLKTLGIQIINGLDLSMIAATVTSKVIVAVQPSFKHLEDLIMAASAELVALKAQFDTLSADVAARDAAQLAKETAEAAQIVTLTTQVNTLTAQLQAGGATLSAADLALIQAIKDGIAALDATQVIPVV